VTHTALLALRSSLLWASLALLLVMVPGILAAYALARWEFRGKQVVAALLSLPLVLPPTAVGYLLLRLFAWDGPLGQGTLGVDLGVILTWRAVVIASAVMALPLLVRTARVAFEGVDPRYEQLSRTLGYGRAATFARVTLPLAARGLLAALILGFTRALGEFGATIVLAGNIPGRTQTLATALFSAEQAGRQQEAGFLMLVALLAGFAAVLGSELLARRRSGA
jgi:molybdate transport system permease protein